MPDPFLMFRTWPQMLQALVILVPAIGVGWTLCAYPRFPLVRALKWWLSRLMVPRLRRPGWLARTILIFGNNSIALALTLAGGFYWPAAVVLIALLGLGLGIGMHHLSHHPPAEFETDDPDAVRPWKLQLGFALNMLEPPAIVAVMGLALGQAAIPLPVSTVWWLYVVYILPLLLIAAAGESYWIEQLV